MVIRRRRLINCTMAGRMWGFSCLPLRMEWSIYPALLRQECGRKQPHLAWIFWNDLIGCILIYWSDLIGCIVIYWRDVNGCVVTLE